MSAAKALGLQTLTAAEYQAAIAHGNVWRKYRNFPPALVERCLMAGLPKGQRCVVFDPFGGAGTTCLVAMGHDGIMIEGSAEYVEIARRRIAKDSTLFADVTVEIDPKAESRCGSEQRERVATSDSTPVQTPQEGAD